jgi:gluconokinase
MSDAPTIVVMGVSGAGKSTIARMLAGALDREFIDADDLHSEDARAKMASGTPLTDEDRLPWLNRVGARIAEVELRGSPAVVACSALRRVYRDVLASASPGGAYFVHLDGASGVIAERMRTRPGHFMPTSMLGSQIATLEPLESDEAGERLSVEIEAETLVAQIVGRWARS